MYRKIELASFKNHKPEHREPPVVIVQEYRGLTTHERNAKIANDYSGNGKCWWIRKFLSWNPTIIKRVSR